MKRIYALLFNISIISTYSVAKTNQIDSKFETNKHKQNTHSKSTKKEKFKFANYKISDGDTLFTIARKHHTTISEVEIVNKLEKDERLNIGRVLKVPVNTYFPKELSKNIKKNSTSKKPLPNKKHIAKQTSIETKHTKTKHAKAKTHTIKSGDTLLAIAINNDITVAEIEKLNGFGSDQKLKIGKEIKISKEIKVAKKSKKIAKNNSSKKNKKKIASKKDTKILKHTIKKGDTLYSIAHNNNTTVVDLQKLNQLSPKIALKIGDVILLEKIIKSSKKQKDKIKIASTKKTNAKSSKKLTEKKLAQKNKIKKKQKIAAAKKSEKKKIKIASKKPLRKRLVVAKRKSKKSFLESLGLGSSALKLTSAKKQLGKRYVWGAVGPYSFDCSGFTKYVCKANGVCIPRTSIKQSKVGKRVSLKNLKAGDLIFFDTSRRHRGYVNHVGIYIGNNKFIHASSAKRKVVITSLKIPFYRSRFKWGSRVKG